MMLFSLWKQHLPLTTMWLLWRKTSSIRYISSLTVINICLLIKNGTLDSIVIPKISVSYGGGDPVFRTLDGAMVTIYHPGVYVLYSLGDFIIETSVDCSKDSNDIYVTKQFNIFINFDDINNIKLKNSGINILELLIGGEYFTITSKGLYYGTNFYVRCTGLCTVENF